MDSMADRLRAKGLKVTPQRVAIYGLLLDTNEHPTAERLWEEVKKEHVAVSFNTVYTTLHALIEAGLIQRLHSGNAAHYDADMAPHVHLSCQVCGEVGDCSADIGIDLLGISPRAQEATGFCTEKVELTLYGCCAHCATTATSIPRAKH